MASSMVEGKLGSSPSIYDGRDAVHVAIVPATAGQPLKACQRVVRCRDDGFFRPAAEPDEDDDDRLLDYDGVVDPFGPMFIGEGERFWLCLRPGMVNSMQHVWDSHDFPTNPKLLKPTKEEAEAWMKAFLEERADSMPAYRHLKQELRTMVNVGENRRLQEEDHGCETSKWVLVFYNMTATSGRLPQYFWDCWEVILGCQFQYRPSIFGCACR